MAVEQAASEKAVLATEAAAEAAAAALPEAGIDAAPEEEAENVEEITDAMGAVSVD